MKNQTRRDFFKVSGGALTASALAACSMNAAPPAEHSKQFPLQLGMASYTFRKFSTDECIEMTQNLGLTKIAFKSFHLEMDATDQECADAAAKVQAAGLDLYGGGVIYMKSEDEVKNAFRYAKAAGMKTIIGVPAHELLDLVEEKVKETDITLAIHNHGPGDKVYPSPESAYEKLVDRDPRMGLCMDIGHTQRIALDPAAEFIKFKDRIFDIHVKDVSASTADGHTVEIGRGVIDFPKFLSTLIEHQYSGVVALEYEKNGENPLPGAAESIGYLRGMLAMM